MERPLADEPSALAPGWDEAREDLLATFSAADVAAHSGAADCWVIVHGDVYDVSKFLSEHPGGPAALSKPGRAGKDVTEHFERIGHSAAARARLAGMRVGRLAESSAPSAPAAAEPAQSPMTGLAYDHALAWHGKRRAAILEAHPEVATLAGANPWTPLIGLVAGAVHAAVALHCGALGFLPLLLLAYTVGAMCKMAQFAVCHDVCHGTCGRLCKVPWVRQLVIHACTLPSFGGETQHYYQYQHVGHHAALGDMSFAVKPGSSGAGEGFDFRGLDEYDGDLPSPGTLLLLAGSYHEVRREAERIAAHLLARRQAGVDVAEQGVGGADEVASWLRDAPRWLLACIDPAGWVAKLLAQPVVVFVHTTWLVGVQLLVGVVLNPLVIVIAAASLAVPCASLAACARRVGSATGARWADHLAVEARAFAEKDASGKLRALMWDGLGFGLHTWLWASVLVALGMAGVRSARRLELDSNAARECGDDAGPRSLAPLTLCYLCRASISFVRCGAGLWRGGVPPSLRALPARLLPPPVRHTHSSTPRTGAHIRASYAGSSPPPRFP